MAAIDFRVSYEALLPVRPNDLDAVYLGFFSKAEVGGVCMLRAKRVSGHELSNLFSRGCSQDYPGADR